MLTPPTVAVNVTAASTPTGVVVTGTWMFDDPDGTFTDAGRPATPALLLDRVTVTPAAGAAWEMLTVSVVFTPPVSEESASIVDEIVAAIGGFTVNVACRVTPAETAVKITGVCDCTALVATGTSTDDEPLSICAEPAIVATFVLALDNVTAVFERAFPLSVSRRVAPCPPLTVEARKAAD